MKSVLIAVITLFCATQVRAQKLPVLPKQQPLPQFRLFPDSLNSKKFSFKLPDSLGKFKTDPVLRQSIIANANIDNMPVARPLNNSLMPVVQTDRTAYTMPVVGMQQPRVYIMNNKYKPEAPAGGNVK